MGSRCLLCLTGPVIIFVICCDSETRLEEIVDQYVAADKYLYVSPMWKAPATLG